MPILSCTIQLTSISLVVLRTIGPLQPNLAVPGRRHLGDLPLDHGARLDAMINVFNTTGAQEGACGVIFFVDSTADIIGGVCQGGSIMAWMPTSVMQSVLTTLQSPRYYSYLTWYPFNKLATLTSVAPQAISQRPHDSTLVPSEAKKSVH